MTRSMGRLATVHFVVAFIVCTSFYLMLPVLWDGDSYYHLAVSRLYAQEGVFAKIPWARLSLLSEGADKEFLFHVLLIPFAGWGDPAIGGRVALGMFNAAIITTLGVLCARAAGSVGFLFPWWIWLGSPLLFARVIRLRPELLALLLFLLALPAIARRRYWAVFALAFALALGYTAHHAFIALMLGLAVIDWWSERRADVRLLVLPVAGAALGWCLRPYPVANAKLWFVQNVLFFVHKSQLDVGPEIFPPSPSAALLKSAPWLVGAIVLSALAIRARGRDKWDDKAFIRQVAFAAAVFFVLFCFMGRMATYLFPMMTLLVALLVARHIRAGVVAGVAAVSLVAGLPLTFSADVRSVIQTAGSAVSELDWEQFGRAVPPGAKIAAHWSAAETFAFWAPQGRYLNVLDPIFMALPYPREYAAQRRMLDGLDPDIPTTLAKTLRSDYLALDFTLAHPTVQARLRSDPRLEVVYGGYSLLLRVREAPPRFFVTDWTPSPPPRDAVAGFIDVSQLATAGCATVSHAFEVTAESRNVSWSFAPWGRSELRLDGAVVTSVDRPQWAVISTAKRVAAELQPGMHRIDIRTCRERGVAGFYLIDERVSAARGSVVAAPASR